MSNRPVFNKPDTTESPGASPVKRVILNPEFDPRMKSIGSPTTPGGNVIKRGRIVKAASNKEGAGETLRFMYNPLGVSVNHNAGYISGSNTAVPGSDGSTDYTKNIGVLFGLGNMSVELYFDRTYEVWDSSKKDKTFAGRLGVHADVVSFYRYFRMISKKTYEGALEKPAYSGSLWEGIKPQFPMNAGIFSHLHINDRLSYYGYFDSMSVTYTHFSRSLVPTRCVINLSFQVNPESDNFDADSVDLYLTNRYGG